MPKRNAALRLTLPRPVVRELAAEAATMNAATPRGYAALVLAGLKPAERRRAYVRALRASLDALPLSGLDLDERAAAP